MSDILGCFFIYILFIYIFVVVVIVLIRKVWMVCVCVCVCVCVGVCGGSLSIVRVGSDSAGVSVFVSRIYFLTSQHNTNQRKETEDNNEGKQGDRGNETMKE